MTDATRDLIKSRSSIRAGNIAGWCKGVTRPVGLNRDIHVPVLPVRLRRIPDVIPVVSKPNKPAALTYCALSSPFSDDKVEEMIARAASKRLLVSQAWDRLYKKLPKPKKRV